MRGPDFDRDSQVAQSGLDETRSKKVEVGLTF